jgi:hypothetical protein
VRIHSRGCPACELAGGGGEIKDFGRRASDLRVRVPLRAPQDPAIDPRPRDSGTQGALRAKQGVPPRFSSRSEGYPSGRSNTHRGPSREPPRSRWDARIRPDSGSARVRLTPLTRALRPGRRYGPARRYDRHEDTVYASGFGRAFDADALPDIDLFADEMGATRSCPAAAPAGRAMHASPSTQQSLQLVRLGPVERR